MKKVVVIALLIASIAFVRAEAARIVNLEDLVVPARTDGTPFSSEEVRMLIMKGCADRQWTPEYEGESVITCSILVRGQHFVEVEIPFSEAGYSILYRDSEEMDYDADRQTIHRKYNGWVNNLRMMIERQFLDAAQEPAGSVLTDPDATGAHEQRYEALLKLGELRDKGLITDEEFAAEKAKLLDQD